MNDTGSHEPAEGMPPEAFGSGGRVDPVPGLTLAVADFALANHLGRDVELSFYAVAPTAAFMRGFRDNAIGPQDVDTDEVYLQTARVRMSPAAIAHLVVNGVLALRGEGDAYYERAKRALSVVFSEDGGEDVKAGETAA